METKYLIKRGDMFLKNHPSLHHWTFLQEQAIRFNTMVMADAIAIMDLGLSIEEYEVVEEHANS